MRTVKMLATDEVIEVSNLDAHALIDSGKAVLYKPEEKKNQFVDTNKMMQAQKPKGYVIK